MLLFDNHSKNMVRGAKSWAHSIPSNHQSMIHWHIYQVVLSFPSHNVDFYTPIWDEGQHFTQQY